MNGPQNFGLLRAIAKALRLLSWVVLAAGVILLIVALVSMGSAADQFTRTIWGAGAVVLPILGVVWFVQLYSFGSILTLLVEIEQNTRELAERS